MASASRNWSVPFLLISMGLILHACSSTPQAMNDYQRAQLELQRQQQAINAANQTSANSLRMIQATTQMLNAPTPNYLGDEGTTQCVTGQDAMGRLVTQCANR